MQNVYVREHAPPMTSIRRAHDAARETRPGVAAAARVNGGDTSARTGPGVYVDPRQNPFDADIRPSRATTGGRILSVRVSREEALAFDAVIGPAGFASRSEALRVLVRGAGGAFAPLPEEADLLATLARELHKIGVNVNQIALAANRRQIALMRAEWDEIAGLRKLLPELRLAIARLVGRRRQAGGAALGGPVGAPRTGASAGSGDA